jgi:hypothetical protein
MPWKTARWLLVALANLLASGAAHALPVWDIGADWSTVANPNGAWSLRQGTTALPGATFSSPFADVWAPGTQGGTFLPFWAKAVADDPTSGAINTFLAGDVVVHSVDANNGNLSLGEANVAWTSPISGVVDISGALWFAQSPTQRSNDFVLLLNGVSLTSGTVSAANGHDRSDPLAFGVAGLSVQQGDVVMLVIQRSGGMSNGAISGVRLSLTQVPEPACIALIALGSGAALSRRGARRARRGQRAE